ncbi:hypothetical protein FRAHR75_960002 [Frankia sp. Hr75.2]|nr:hypothetical protein FRAHR75_960002 [Frankia sp. Hr75.2]SQD99735.1 hypothetical protein FMEAI12_5590003 [Parafrankia sp. Ea1.12]
MGRVRPGRPGGPAELIGRARSVRAPDHRAASPSPSRPCTRRQASHHRLAWLLRSARICRRQTAKARLIRATPPEDWPTIAAIDHLLANHHSEWPSVPDPYSEAVSGPPVRWCLPQAAQVLA